MMPRKARVARTSRAFSRLLTDARRFAGHGCVRQAFCRGFALRRASPCRRQSLLAGHNLRVSDGPPEASKKQGMVITRKVEFSASHVCRVPSWSDDQNRATFGEAAHPHGHGHNYAVEVSVEGAPDPITGMVIDLKDPKADPRTRDCGPPWTTAS